jgi:hypothetical protein
MTRRACLGLPLTLAFTAACRHEPAPLRRDVFPEAVGVWRRTGLREVPASEAPDPVPRPSIRRLEVAAYEGPGKLEARVYELTDSAVGLDLAQRWRPSADTVFFWDRNYFVVVKWQEADRKALQEFLRDLEARLKQRG